MKKRYLTKSRFKLACECPAKLYYTGKPAEYADSKLEDSFLAALAEGGFQVGELAKHYYPGGVDITTLDYDESLRQTGELLKRDRVVIFEAAVAHGNLFCRVDILVKDGTHLQLLEVKAKSFSSADGEEEFLKKDGEIRPGWLPYLEDVAFQKYVLKKAFPRYTVAAYLMLADKDARCPTDGLNQKFKITEVNGRKSVRVSPPITPADVSKPILATVRADEYCLMIYEQDYELHGCVMDFGELVRAFADAYEADTKLAMPVSKACKGCEFRASAVQKADGLKSGYEECFAADLGWSAADCARPMIFDIWNFRKTAALVEEGRLLMAQVTPADFSFRPAKNTGLSAAERQWMQVEKTNAGDNSYYLDEQHLAEEIATWVFPLHFIDFETSMVAVPFHKGRHPYEGIAFQFSHHTVFADGSVEHTGEFLEIRPGVFPNYEFLRALKKELENDKGSVFRYAAHENSFLNLIYHQLAQESSRVTDRRELMAFIKTITTAGKYSPEQWHGERSMIDMCDLVKRFYYDPRTNGSNSIKQVLPAILNRSAFLQQTYSKPVYGAIGGIKSRNYQDKIWIERGENGEVADPYYLLPRLFDDCPEAYDTLLANEQLFSSDTELHDGGAAMTAYCKLQFTEMSDAERAEIEKALLKYCELDTFAMVMLYQGWLDLLG